MNLSKKKAKIVLDAVSKLQAEQVIAPDVAHAIRDNIVTVDFDWRQLARYSFIAAISCIVIAVLTIALDEAIIRWFEQLLPLLAKIFRAPPLVRAGVLTCISAVIFWLGLKRRSRFPDRIHSNEAVFTAGTLGLAGVGFTLSQLPQLAGHDALLCASFGIIYLAIGTTLSSKLVWGYGLFTLTVAIGMANDGASHRHHFWGNPSVHYLGYGLILCALSTATTMSKAVRASGLHAKLQLMNPLTRVAGLLHLFIPLWILSITGNHRYGADFMWDELMWGMLSVGVTIGVFTRGFMKADPLLQRFGITFFFINLYTGYFEYFWGGLHKAFFFAILGISFWLIGRKAENLWNLTKMVQPNPPSAGELPKADAPTPKL